jgi:hypothetical protein
MQTYTYNIPVFNQQQVLDEILSNMGLRLFNNYTDDPTSQGSSYIFNGALVLNFNDDLDFSQITELNTIINDYVYDPNYDDLKKFKINNSFENPSSLDYDIMGFNKKRTFISGELREVGYYRDYDYTAKTYSDLVVLETREYTRDTIGMAVSRFLTSTWYLNDGTTGLTTSYSKYYSPEEAIQEGIDRRTNMLSFAKTTLLSGLAQVYGEPANQTYAFDLLTSVKTQMEYFTQGYTQPLRDAVSASTKPYMSETIKIDVIRQLTF